MRPLNPIKKLKYKKSRKEGKSIEQSLLDAGLAATAARTQPKSLKLAKIGDAEILTELKKEDYTIDLLISRLETGVKMALDANDISNYRGFVELIGRYLSAWRDNQQVEIVANTVELWTQLRNYRDSIRATNAPAAIGQIQSPPIYSGKSDTAEAVIRQSTQAIDNQEVKTV